MLIERGKFISIHGVDGTGKTTTSSKTHDLLIAQGQKSINYDTYKEADVNPFSEKKKDADKNGSLEDRIVAYLESTMYHSKKIDALLNDGYHVVKSRYVDDVLAHFAHLGISEERLNEFKEKFPIVQPDLKVILTLDEEVRRQRIDKRGILDERDIEIKKEGSRLLFFEDFLKKSAEKASKDSILYIDTGSIDSDTVAKKIVDHLKL